MNEEQYNDLKNAIYALGGKAQEAFEAAGSATQAGYFIIRTRIIAESIVTIIVTVLACLILTLIFFYLKKSVKKFNKKKENKYSLWIDEPYNQIAVIVWGVFVVITLLLLLPMAIYAVVNLMSPDYATISRIIDIYKTIN